MQEVFHNDWRSKNYRPVARSYTPIEYQISLKTTGICHQVLLSGVYDHILRRLRRKDWKSRNFIWKANKESMEQQEAHN